MSENYRSTFPLMASFACQLFSALFFGFAAYKVDGAEVGVLIGVGAFLMQHGFMYALFSLHELKFPVRPSGDGR